MLAFILGLCAAWLGDGPTINQPRPQTARAQIHVVVPVAYWEEEAQTSFIPPAPLPEFDMEEIPQIRFEFSRIESCSDSDEHPPAPPAELEFTSRQGVDFDFNLSSCDAESEQGAGQTDSCQAPGDDGPQSVDELHHLRTAIEHLEAAGMPELTKHLRAQYRDAVANLRAEIQHELDVKEAELSRLQQEIQRLRADLGEVPTWESRSQSSVSAAPHSSTIVINGNVVEATVAPEPEPNESHRDRPGFLINPAFYVGEVPEHIQQKWDRAVNGKPADRITSIKSPKWVAPATPALILPQIPREPMQTPPDPSWNGAFRILRFVPAESFPKMVIEPPEHLDDSGIYLQTLPPAPLPEEDAPAKDDAKDDPET